MFINVTEAVKAKINLLFKSCLLKFDEIFKHNVLNSFKMNKI